MPVFCLAIAVAEAAGMVLQASRAMLSSQALPGDVWRKGGQAYYILFGGKKRRVGKQT